MSATLAIIARNAALDAITALLANGFARAYTGAKPATPQLAATGTLLFQLGLAATAFGAAANGVATANAISNDASADATGTAGYLRLFKSDGTTAVQDLDIGGTAQSTTGEFQMATSSVVLGAIISCSSFTLTLPQ